MTELQYEGRRATALRLLRAVQHYESKGVLSGELPPSGDYFGRRKLSNNRAGVAEVIVLQDVEERSLSLVDVEAYMLQARLSPPTPAARLTPAVGCAFTLSYGASPPFRPGPGLALVLQHKFSTRPPVRENLIFIRGVAAAVDRQVS